jgi:hypothetical protein
MIVSFFVFDAALGDALASPFPWRAYIARFGAGSCSRFSTTDADTIFNDLSGR